jgi:hypothetical protein
MDLKKLIEEDGCANVIHAVADAMDEIANEEEDYQTAEVMRIEAQKLRDFFPV